MRNYVKETREALAMTQQEMADSIGVKIETVKALERDARLPANKVVRENLARLSRRAKIEIEKPAHRAALSSKLPGAVAASQQTQSVKELLFSPQLPSGRAPYGRQPSLGQLATVLAQIVTDYEKCAADVDGHIKPWRRQLIDKARTLLSRMPKESLEDSTH